MMSYQQGVGFHSFGKGSAKMSFLGAQDTRPEDRARILHEIDDLAQKGYLSNIPAARDRYLRTPWDFTLQEIQGKAVDFQEERGWKLFVAQRLAHAVKNYWQDKHRESIEYVARQMSAGVMQFWLSAQAHHDPETIDDSMEPFVLPLQSKDIDRSKRRQTFTSPGISDGLLAYTQRVVENSLRNELSPYRSDMHPYDRPFQVDTTSQSAQLIVPVTSLLAPPLQGIVAAGPDRREARRSKTDPWRFLESGVASGWEPVDPRQDIFMMAYHHASQEEMFERLDNVILAKVGAMGRPSARKPKSTSAVVHGSTPSPSEPRDERVIVKPKRPRDPTRFRAESELVWNPAEDSALLGSIALFRKFSTPSCPLNWLAICSAMKRSQNRFETSTLKFIRAARDRWKEIEASEILPDVSLGSELRLDSTGNRLAKIPRMVASQEQGLKRKRSWSRALDKLDGSFRLEGGDDVEELTEARFAANQPERMSLANIVKDAICGVPQHRPPRDAPQYTAELIESIRAVEVPEIIRGTLPEEKDPLQNRVSSIERLLTDTLDDSVSPLLSQILKMDKCRREKTTKKKDSERRSIQERRNTRTPKVHELLPNVRGLANPPLPTFSSISNEEPSQSARSKTTPLFDSIASSSINPLPSEVPGQLKPNQMRSLSRVHSETNPPRSLSRAHSDVNRSA